MNPSTTPRERLPVGACWLFNLLLSIELWALVVLAVGALL
jgi:hypothetical protein